MVIVFKTIYLNTFTVLIVNLETKMVLYKYDHPHLWEFKMDSTMLKFNDLLILSYRGTQIMNLGAQESKIIQTSD